MGLLGLNCLSIFRKKMILQIYEEETTSSPTINIVSSSEGTVPEVTTVGVDDFAELEPAWKTAGFEFLEGVDSGAWFVMVVCYLTLFLVLRILDLCCCRG